MKLKNQLLDRDAQSSKEYFDAIAKNRKPEVTKELNDTTDDSKLKNTNHFFFFPIQFTLQ
jgi:hypothetical protein